MENEGPQVMRHKPRKKVNIQDTTIPLKHLPTINIENIPSIDRSNRKYIVRKFIEDMDPEHISVLCQFSGADQKFDPTRFLTDILNKIKKVNFRGQTKNLIQLDF